MRDPKTFGIKVGDRVRNLFVGYAGEVKMMTELFYSGSYYGDVLVEVHDPDMFDGFGGRREAHINDLRKI